MRGAINLVDPKGYETAFGDVGLKVGSRTGLNKRNKDDMEWYVIRRFLKETINTELFDFPLQIRNGSAPSEPDFVLEHKSGRVLFEITEATNEADQKEMTAIEKSDQAAVLIGEFGGRFHGGLSQPGMPWADDIVDAIERKAGKIIFAPSDVSRNLIIYPNSNASVLLSDDDDEMDAAKFLQAAITRKRQGLIQITNGCRVHILAKENVFLDVVGNFTILKRRHYI